ncbi:leucine-rich repeat-containing protein 20 isoform X2 [Gracilinanus agilis]|uniref:leucine-rich repeat-containing protein 20 isoform X2 n=1 Tax=Gracilinanus agilis TaxID=191870 RepID=UPI001CFEADCF|nr:leucine-rich repeat-containing protein 20 isoform X2 [Gracilinanus agilis]
MLIGFPWVGGGPSAFLVCADWSGLGARVRLRLPCRRLWSRGRASEAEVRHVGRRGPEPVSTPEAPLNTPEGRVCMLSKMGEAVARVARKVNETVESGSDTLDLAECKLVSFPVAIYKVLRTVAERIRLVILADNELQTLSGKFMTTFGQLRELRLEGNCLHRLPDEVGSLQHLQAINLSRNQFQDFPEQLTALQALETINLEENEIVGLLLCLCLPLLLDKAVWGRAQGGARET